MSDINPLLVSSFSLAVLIDIGAPIVLGVYLARRCKARWSFWFLGALVFLVFQGLTRVPAMLFLQTRPFMKTALEQPVYLWSFYLFAAFTAGLFEEGGRWVLFRFLVRKEDRRWGTAAMVGAGHGGLEAIAIGVLQLTALIFYLVVILVPQETFGAAAQQFAVARAQYDALAGWEPLLGGWERLCAIAIQVALTIMVLRAFTHGARWWWYALAAHTVVDFLALAVIHLGAVTVGQPASMLMTECMVGVLAALAVIFIAKAATEAPITRS